MDKSRCPICGRPNGCAMERGRVEAGRAARGPAEETALADAAEHPPAAAAAHPPCWCLERRVPPRLTELLDLVAAARGGERACACSACVDYFEAAEDAARAGGLD